MVTIGDIGEGGGGKYKFFIVKHFAVIVFSVNITVLNNSIFGD